MITPEDIYNILHIPFHGPHIEYDTQPRLGTLALRAIFQYDIIIGRGIPCEELVQVYGPIHRLEMVLGTFLGWYCYQNFTHAEFYFK